MPRSIVFSVIVDVPDDDDRSAGDISRAVMASLDIGMTLAGTVRGHADAKGLGVRLGMVDLLAEESAPADSGRPKGRPRPDYDPHIDWPERFKSGPI